MLKNIQESFTKELPADPITTQGRRQVIESCYSFAIPKSTTHPFIISVADDVAELLGLSQEETKSSDFRDIFTGNKLVPNTQPYAMCYGGHQFGNWAGQLGDGRAINLTEIVVDQKRWAIQLKGAGETPYSRTADGLAVLRSSIREYLCSEAMHNLGVPTTRALSLALTGDEVLRDVMYNGNQAYEKGAVVCRIAPSFLRFGSYQIFTSRGDNKTLKTLVDYTIKYFYSDLGEPNKATYIKLFQRVAELTLDMIIHWQRVGFVHGVMNTDNLSILGLTIDYGPYGWLEGYDHNWTPNTTDNQHKRYRYGNQSNIGLWNLLQLANAFYPLVEETKPLEAVLHNYQRTYFKKYHKMMCDKLGVQNEALIETAFIKKLESTLQLTETDMTIFFRNLANVNKEDNSAVFLSQINEAFYQPDDVQGEVLEEWIEIANEYISLLQQDNLDNKVRKAQMNTVNPKYVLRNYMAQLAIDDAEKGNYNLIEELMTLLKNPYNEQRENEKWFSKRPEWARNKVGCSKLSCSS